MDLDTPHVSRRRMLLLATAAVSGSVNASAATEAAHASGDASTLRVASVSTDVEGGLLPALLESFAAHTKIQTALAYGNDPYGAASKGEADLVVSHFGHRDTQRFVTEGLGHWPRTVFSNQAALIGPPSDPAGVRGTTDLVEAFRRIAAAGAPYVVNDGAGMRYLSQILWHGAGQPPLGAWYLDDGTKAGSAIDRAAQNKAYFLWGLTPFVREQKANPRAFAPLLTADPLLQRLMVAVPVNAARIQGVNAEAARRLVDYLLSPDVQARILGTAYLGAEQAFWAPAGRHNAGNLLPKS